MCGGCKTSSYPFTASNLVSNQNLQEGRMLGVIWLHRRKQRTNAAALLVVKAAVAGKKDAFSSTTSCCSQVIVQRAKEGYFMPRVFGIEALR